MSHSAMFITQSQLDRLPEYSRSTPSGVYVNKIWKAKLRDGEWQVRTFEKEPDQINYPGTVKNGYYTPIISAASSIRLGENRGGATVFTRDGEEYEGDYAPVDWFDYLSKVELLPGVSI